MPTSLSFKKQPSVPQETQNKVQILVRIRPTLFSESPQDFVQMVETNTLRIKRPGNSMYMKFHTILDQSTCQQDIFNQVMPSVFSFMQGNNETIFA